MAQVLRKLNSEGQFTLFPGVTVVADVDEKTQPNWTRLYQKLNDNELIKSFYALLPPGSYHMTTMDLYTQAATTDNWLDFINNKLFWFQQLHSGLQREAFQPTTTAKGIYVESVICVELELPKDQMHKLHTLAGEFEIVKKTPNIFHVTLGYCYKGYVPPAQRTQIEEAVTTAFNECCEQGSVLTFDQPKLRYFMDMTKFTVWDGQTNPF